MIDWTRASVPQLLASYAQILTELEHRAVIRTRNAPLGDYSEYLAHRVYGGVIAANSSKSYDIAAADGRLIQVKARTQTLRAPGSQVFSSFRSWEFHAAVFLVFDPASYDLLWARELSPDDVREFARFSAHVNAHLIRVPVVHKLGRDVTAAFHRVLAELADKQAHE